MRLDCPNCAAIYEVDDAAVPASGRRVRCAACNTGWRVSGDGATVPSDEEKRLKPSADPLAPIPKPTPDIEPSDVAARAPETHGDQSEPRKVESADPPAAEPKAEPPATTVGEQAASAETRDKPEAKAKPDEPAKAKTPEPEKPATDAGGGLADKSKRKPKFKLKPLEPPKGIKIPNAPKVEKEPAIARDEPIPAGLDDDLEPTAGPLRSIGGFAVGFSLVLLIFAPYLFRTQIVAAVPAASPVVEAYVSVIQSAQNGVRVAYEFVAAEVDYLANGLPDAADPPSAPPPETASSGQ